MTDTDNRLHALEARVAHQDNVIEDLSDVLAKQWKEISQLNGRIDYLKRKLQELEDGMEASPPGDKPPPHY